MNKTWPVVGAGAAGLAAARRSQAQGLAAPLSDGDTAHFPPTLEAIAARLSRLDVARYGRTRNAFDGAVTGPSPYVTHGLIDPPVIVAAAQARTALSPQDKFLMQLGWREFFAHVWRHEGERILSDLRPAISAQPYARRLPDDVLQAATGVPVIDQAVRQL